MIKIFFIDNNLLIRYIFFIFQLLAILLLRRGKGSAYEALPSTSSTECGADKPVETSTPQYSPSSFI